MEFPVCNEVRRLVVTIQRVGLPNAHFIGKSFWSFTSFRSLHTPPSMSLHV